MLPRHTNVEQKCAIVPLVDNVLLQDLVVESLGTLDGGRHVVMMWKNVEEKKNG